MSRRMLQTKNVERLSRSRTPPNFGAEQKILSEQESRMSRKTDSAHLSFRERMRLQSMKGNDESMQFVDSRN